MLALGASYPRHRGKSAFRCSRSERRYRRVHEG